MWPDAFRRFNPLGEHLSETWGLPILLNRALPLIRNRSLEELKHALKILYTMRLEFVDAAFLEDLDDLRASSQRRTPFTATRILTRAMREFDIDDQEGFPNAKWSEYFAVAALGQIGDIISTQRELADDSCTAPLPEPHSGYSAGYFLHAIEAMDLLCEASRLREAEEHRSAARETGRQGGLKKVEEFTRIRIRVEELFDTLQNSRESVRKIAGRIWEKELTDEERGVFRGENPKERIYKWILDYRRRSQKHASTP